MRGQTGRQPRDQPGKPIPLRRSAGPESRLQVDGMIEVEVRLYGHLGEFKPGLKPGEAIPVTLPVGSPVSKLFEALALPAETVRVVFVNGIICEPDHVLQAGDRVGIFPPIAGGGTQPAEQDGV